MAQVALSLTFWAHFAAWILERILALGVHGVHLMTRLMTWAAGITYAAIDSIALWLAVPFFVLGLVVATRAALRVVAGERRRMPTAGTREPKGCN